MRTFIASIFALLSLALVSCSDGDEFYNSNMAETSKYDNNTRAKKIGDAHVRFAMFSDMNGYNVRVKNMRIENCTNSNEVPAIGTAITDADKLPLTEETKLFDNASGEYNKVTTSSADDSWVIVHFDLEITSNDDFDSNMEIKDVKYYINPNEVWVAGGYYDYTIKIDAEYLGLSEIEFGAYVEDFQN